MIQDDIKGSEVCVESKPDEAAAPCEATSAAVGSVLPRPSDLTGYFDAGALADAAGTIPSWVAKDRSDIVRLWIPKTVVSIGSFAFRGCANLEEVVFEASEAGACQEIGTMAFAGCPKLAKVQLSAAVRSIGSGAFRDDGALTTLLVDSSWMQVRVGAHAFDGCPSPDELRNQIAKAEVEVKNEVKPRKRAAAKPRAPEKVPTAEELEEFGAFWQELVQWWGVPDKEEILVLKEGHKSYTLKCAWNEDLLVVGMITPWAREWDYVQLYRGRFGFGDVGNGFYGAKMRKKVAKLLLKELIRRNKWMRENPYVLAKRYREVKESMEADREGGGNPPLWFAEYRWIRNRMAVIGEGDMRLYVKGDNHIWGTPIHCEWAMADMRGG